MSAVEHEFHSIDIHPIDMVETLAEQSDWEFDRVGENQIAMAIEGQWRTYSLSLNWSSHDDTLKLLCTFEYKPPEERQGEVLALLNLVNERIWSGAFTFWAEQEVMAFRYGLTLAGGAAATPEQIEAMVLSAVGLAERFYPGFQLVGWSDETAEEAIDIAIAEAYGRA